jgi:tetratricopeptide (TPR) repeat protein
MGQADMLNNLGLDYFSSAEWPEAIQRFRECLEIAERIGDTELVAIVRNNLGEVHLALGEVEEAKGEFREAVTIAVQIGNGALTGLAQANLGEALTIERDIAEARTVLRKSVRTLKKVGAQSLMMEAEVRLAELHFAAHDYYAAETLANRLADTARRTAAPWIEARALRLLGDLAARRKRPDEAKALFERSIALFAETGAAHGEAKSRLALARATGDRTEARRALRAFRRLGAARDVGEAEGLLAA